MNVPHISHRVWASGSVGNSEEEDSEPLPISQLNWTKLTDLMNCFILLDLLLSSHIAAFVSNISYHLQLAHRPCPILADDDLAFIIHAFITSWLVYSSVIKPGVMPTALRKLQLTEKAGTHLGRHTGYHGSIKPPYRDFPWNFISSLNSFSTITHIYTCVIVTMGWKLFIPQKQKKITSFSSLPPKSSFTFPSLI